MSARNTKDHARHGFDTRTVNNGRDPAAQGGMVNPPVYHGSTIIHSSLADLDQARINHNNKDALIYGRFGSNSTFALENAVADLENGFGGVSVSSGLAAVTTAILSVVQSGDHLLMVDSVYGPSRAFCENFLRALNVEVTFYDPLIGSDIERLIKPNTSMVFLESPGSLSFEVQDVPAIVEVAKRHDIVTAADNSWATPLFYRPIDHGVNMSVIAGTKYIVGHADAMLGMIVTDEENFYRVKRCRDLLGQSLAPDDVYLGMRGLRTLGIRIRQHEQQALQLAHWLNRHPDVEKVLHPALPDCPGHEIWKRDFSGSSGLFSFIVADRGREALATMLDNLALFDMGFSWGSYESLIVPQDPSKSRSAVPWNHQGQLLRVHVGLEDIDDLIADLSAGLERYRSFTPG